MSTMQILDCTLRDGGYINNFNFGRRAISEIIKKLGEAQIDIIECGFLKSQASDRDKTLFDRIESFTDVIQKRNSQSMYVAMAVFGDISESEISPASESMIDGIRITFHEHEIDGAFEFAQALQIKGYQVFIQPVGTTSYSDEALLNLVRRVNAIKPFAFYLVDTLGSMYQYDLLRMLYLVDHNLADGIKIGFHSHNNLQLSFAHALQLLQQNTKRIIIADSSVFGMGRGAGNLNTELITQFINTHVVNKYDVVPLLEIMDDYLNPIFQKYSWGYSAPYFIASNHDCHPSYATYLMNKQTLAVKDIYKILKKIDPSESTLYNNQYIEQLYLEYQQHNISDLENVQKLQTELEGKQVLLIAPGSSLANNEERIREFISSHDVITISINFVPLHLPVQRLFISNLKRFDNLTDGNLAPFSNLNLLVTSNIPIEESNQTLKFNYKDLLTDHPLTLDNAGLMAINLMIRVGVKSIALAGFDGFSSNSMNNYYKDMTLVSLDNDYNQRNLAVSDQLRRMKNKVILEFLTPSRYQGALESEGLT